MKPANRELRKILGAQAAEILEQQRTDVAALSAQHRVLARQMLELERTIAVVREGREADRKQLGAKVDVLRLDLAALEKKLDETERRRLDLNTSMCHVLCWLREYFELSPWQRFWRGVTYNPFAAPTVEVIHNPTPEQREAFFQ